jgi:hypothetical protein
LSDGKVTFDPGLGIAGDWVGYFLLNDGYTILASNPFKIVDPSATLVRTDKRIYEKGTDITATFNNGPGNPKDWIGIYKAGETPGGPDSTLWYYVNGTKNFDAGLANGTITFKNGLAQTGDYVVYFLENDGYNILSSETFSVVEPAATGARIVSISPIDASQNLPPRYQFKAVLTNGTTKVITGSIVLKLDGNVVTPQVTTQGEGTTVEYTSDTLPPANSQHVFELSFTDNGTPAATVTRQVNFGIGAYNNISLSSPIYFNDFNSVPEGELPTGWTEKNFTDVQNEDLDLGNLDSASFKTWIAIDADRFKGSFVTYSDPSRSQGEQEDYHRVLTPNLFNVVNGKVLTGPLASGRFLFNDSGYRNGAAQIAYLFTPDFDLTGKANVYVSFHSLWEQNEDSMAALEYSIDQGQTWLPIVYMLDGPDVIKNGDLVDAMQTFTTDHADVAHYIDPDTGEDKGGNYGAFIGAAITQDLAPYISARVDNDPAESKRVELFRLPQADNQGKVRFRFAHAGTDSWYWGIDDFGLYSIPTAGGGQPKIIVSASGSAQIKISWDTAITGYILEQSDNLKTPVWSAVPAVQNNSVTLSTSGTNMFFRLRK